jgi:hypothetical protein
MTDNFLPILSKSLLDVRRPIGLRSLGSSNEARSVEIRLSEVQDRLTQTRRLFSQPVSELANVRNKVATREPLDIQLKAKANTFKRMSAMVAMYLHGDYRTALFAAIDRLVDSDDWDTDAALPSEQSFSTFLRMIIYLHPTRRPGLGLSPSGLFLAAWRSGQDRIVVECLADDEVRWVLSRTIDGERESAAGKVQIHRIPDVTEPYNPEPLFNDGESVLI